MDKPRRSTLAVTLCICFLSTCPSPAGAADFLPCEERTKGPLTWSKLTELGLCSSAEAIKDGQKVKLGGQRWAEPREFRNLRWE